MVFVFDIIDWLQSLPDWIKMPTALLLIAAAMHALARLVKSRAARTLAALAIIWVAAALIMNQAAILANGGRMPVYHPGLESEGPSLVPPGDKVHVEVGDGPGRIPRSSVRLLALCDVIPVNVRGGGAIVSAGDLVAFAGTLSALLAAISDLCLAFFQRFAARRRSPA